MGSIEKTKKKMLEIPVKPFHRVEKFLNRIFKKNILKGEKMNYQQFVQCMIDFFQVYKRNVKDLSPGCNVNS